MTFWLFQEWRRISGTRSLNTKWVTTDPPRPLSLNREAPTDDSATGDIGPELQTHRELFHKIYALITYLTSIVDSRMLVWPFRTPPP